MQGNIDFSGTLSGSIAGGGGGSEVTITPTLSTGAKIADYSIDSETGSLYAPAGISKAQQPLLILGDTISIDLSHYYDKEDIDYTLSHNYQPKLYAYSPIEISGEDYNQISLTFDINDYATKTYVQNNYQPTLIAGTGISIDSITNTISCTASGGIDYSTSEQDTGIKWIDGKNIYRKTYPLNNISISTSGTDLTSYIDNMNTFSNMIKAFCVGNTYKSAIDISVYVYEGHLYGITNSNYGGIDYITIEYTKNS